MSVIQVEIVTPSAVAYKGEAQEVDVPGYLGEFGALAGHAQLLTLTRPGVVTIQNAQGVERLLTGTGFAEVGPFGITLLVDLCEPVDGIDKAKAQADQRAAEAVLESADPFSDEYAIARKRLDLALARLSA
jgi:F-type H+-transporting ATPase subunit epsilon